MIPWKTRAEAKRYIQVRIAHSYPTVVNMLRLLDSYQTAQEVRRHDSIETNGAGFNKADAPFLGGMARKVERGEMLADWELQEVRGRLPKYWNQVRQFVEATEGR